MVKKVLGAAVVALFTLSGCTQTKAEVKPVVKEANVTVEAPVAQKILGGAPQVSPAEFFKDIKKEK